MKKFILLGFILFCFLNWGCWDNLLEFDVKPIAIECDTFVCNINGKYWGATVPPDRNIISFMPGRVSILYDPDSLNGSIWIQAKRDTLEMREAITLYNPIGGGGKGKLKLSGVSYRGTSCSSSIQDTTTYNWIEIVSVDTSKRIVVGNFQAKTLKRTCESDDLTQGYFKIKF